MATVTEAFWTLFDEAAAARAHFHTWWALSNLSRPEFYSTMNNHSIVDFFHVAHDGNYRLFFIALAKFFDRDKRVIGISRFRSMLREEGHTNIADRMENALTPHESIVRKVLNIRNKTISHNELGLPREKVYEINGITPDQIRQLISVVCEVMNDAARSLGIKNSISEGRRLEEATLNLLAQLKRGEKRP